MNTYGFILFRFLCRPTSLAQAATFRRTVEDLAPTDLIFSCIFSQTRGTPMKAVGRTSFKVLTREPWPKKKKKEEGSNHQRPYFKNTTGSFAAQILKIWLCNVTQKSTVCKQTVLCVCTNNKIFYVYLTISYVLPSG